MNKNEKIVFTAARRSGKSLTVEEQVRHKIEFENGSKWIWKGTPKNPIRGRTTWNWKWDIRYPVFDWGINNPCPYIWAGWWLITFDPFKISFMPD